MRNRLVQKRMTLTFV